MRSTTLRLALTFVLLCSVRETFAQSGLADRWVGTWTTAEVGRPQNAGAAGGAAASALHGQHQVSGACHAAGRSAARPDVCAAAVRPLHESDAASNRPHQHRWIESARRPQQRVRDGTGDHRRRAHRASRQTGSHPGGVGRPADVQRKTDDDDSRERRDLQRSGQR